MTLPTVAFPQRLGGNLCLDFTNTVEFRGTERCIDFLVSYERLVSWCCHSALLDDTERARLSALAEQRPHEATQSFHAALDLRDQFYRIFTGVIASAPPAQDDLAALNSTLAAGERRIEPSASGFAWTWDYRDDLRSPLWPLALAAADLLTSDQLVWVRQCPNCGWLFVDTSRNHSRRWCSMDICGSQVKSRRQYERRKQTKV